MKRSKNKRNEEEVRKTLKHKNGIKKKTKKTEKEVTEESIRVHFHLVKILLKTKVVRKEEENRINDREG